MKKKIGLRKRIGLELFSRLHAESVARHELRTLFWECTLRCNLACRHCGSDCRTEALCPDMPAEDFFRVLDGQITPHVDPHRVLVILSGGEVLVRRDLEQIGLALYRRGYPWGMVTNGLALDERRFESLLRAGLHSITVSLDGFREEHTFVRRNERSFDAALAAAEMVAREESVASDVVTCVTPQLMPRIEEFRDMLIERGIRSWRLFTIFPVGRAAADPAMQLSDEDFTRLMEFIARTRREGRIAASYSCEGFLGGYEAEVRDRFYTCQAGVSIASIRVDGSISGCTSIRSNFHQGNIYRDDFWEVWNNRFEPFRNREWARTGECADCKLFRYCLGNGMHLHDDRGELLVCHYRRLRR
ncbi:MAG: TIGR04133 family radical SAM/SPASM protein [Alistipes sp.]|nr:TIGR04133 family radical SAM/SPASM protein [Alistipes sp.]